MIVTKLLLVLLVLLQPLAAIGERANKDDASKTKMDWKLWKQPDGGDCLLTFSRIFLASPISF